MGSNGGATERMRPAPARTTDTYIREGGVLASLPSTESLPTAQGRSSLPVECTGTAWKCPPEGEDYREGQCC